MYTNFASLPDEARLWVYQANRPLTHAEVAQIDASLQPALSQWAAHGQPLLASAQVISNRFVIIAVDEGHSLPSGCSIDASTHFLKSIGGQINVDFFDRSAAYMGPDEQVLTIPLPKIKEAVMDGRLTLETPVFNTLVNTKGDFTTNWIKPASQTWLNRYFGRVIA